jgi:hypothetical protein
MTRDLEGGWVGTELVGGKRAEKGIYSNERIGKERGRAKE